MYINLTYSWIWITKEKAEKYANGSANMKVKEVSVD